MEGLSGMEINPNTKTDAVSRVADRTSVGRPVKGAGDQAVFSRSDALDRAFAATPDVRPDKVVQACELIGQVAYPPRETIAKLSDLLALNINPTAE